MKVIILAGGLQSALSDGVEGIPKPMAEIGGKPIIWHIMKNFAQYGFKEFIVCGGYKVNLIKEYFKDFYIFQSDITVDLLTNEITIHKNISEDWKVTVVDTGLGTDQGKRVLQVRDYIQEDNFIVVYGDCLSNIDYHALTAQHKQSGKLITMSLAHPTGRNKVLPVTEDGLLMPFLQASMAENQVWVDACCQVFNKEVFRYLESDYLMEGELKVVLAEKQEISVYQHHGFWSPVETKRDQRTLEALWQKNTAPWKVWEQ